MDCPIIQWCPACERILIHRGKRSRYESASYLGQIVLGSLPNKEAWRRWPQLTRFFWGDIDGVMWRRSIGLLRFIEHKSPGQSLGPGQGEVLLVLAAMIEHVKQCETWTDTPLHADSGAFLIRGDPHEGNRLGPSTAVNLLTRERLSFDEGAEAEALCWIPLLDADLDRRYVHWRLANRRPNPPAYSAEAFARTLIQHLSPDDLRTVAKLLTQAAEQAA